MYVSLPVMFDYFLFSHLLFTKLLTHNILVAVESCLMWFTEDTYLIYEANSLVPKCRSCTCKCIILSVCKICDCIGYINFWLWLSGYDRLLVQFRANGQIWCQTYGWARNIKTSWCSESGMDFSMWTRAHRLVSTCKMESPVAENE